MSAILFKISVNSFSWEIHHPGNKISHFLFTQTRDTRNHSRKRSTEKAIKSVVDAQAARGRLSRGGVWVTCNCWGRGKLIYWPPEFPTIIRGVYLRRVQGRRSIWFIHLNIYLVIYFINYCFWEECELECPRNPRAASLWIQVVFAGNFKMT